VGGAGSVWPISIPDKPKAATPPANKNHLGKNMESSERIRHALLLMVL
jgi:hypothetical protein